MLLMRAWYGIAAIALLLFSNLPPATAQSLQAIPALTARLMDQTGTLSASQTAAIEARLQAIEDQTGAQVVVLLIPSTGAEDIAPYAHRVASAWKLGRANVGDGMLIVIAKDDRRMRLEVARALEWAIPDVVASRIIEQQMAPNFRKGAYTDGILAALSHIAARISGLPAPADSTVPRRASPSDNDVRPHMLDVDLTDVPMSKAAPSHSPPLRAPSDPTEADTLSTLTYSSQPHPRSSDTWLGNYGVLGMFGFFALTVFLRIKFGAVWSTFIMTTITFSLEFLLSRSWNSALSLAIPVLLITLFINLPASRGYSSSSGSRSSSDRRSNSSSRSGSSGFRSGGGGSFGGGGASGRW